MPAKAKSNGRPSALHVGPFVYVIEWMSNDQWEQANENPGDCGATRADCGSIRVRVTTNASEQHLRETLLHEILHAVWHATSLNALPKGIIDSDNIEETLVAIMSPMMLQVLIDNPQVVGYLHGE